MKSLNIIITDNNIDVLTYNSEILKELDHNVICQCECGIETIEAFKIYRNVVDVIILENKLPDINGKTVFSIINKMNSVFNNIIFFTTSDPRDFKKELEKGCFYIEKTVSLENRIPFFETISKRTKPTITIDIIGSEFIDLTNRLEDINNLSTPFSNFIKKHIKIRLQQIESTLESHRLYQTSLKKLIMDNSK